MSANYKAFQKSGKFTLTSHAKERIRQRVGVDSVEAALAWVNENIASATTCNVEGNKTHYLTEAFDIVCDGLRVVTIKPVDNHTDYLTKFNAVLTKEATKLLTKYRRELRKAEITVAECTLNYLKAKSPKVKQSIQRRLTEATDVRAKISDEIRAVEIAAERYGVEV
jgi:hypothetical protein